MQCKISCVVSDFFVSFYLDFIIFFYCKLAFGHFILVFQMQYVLCTCTIVAHWSVFCYATVTYCRITDRLVYRPYYWIFLFSLKWAQLYASVQCVFYNVQPMHIFFLPFIRMKNIYWNNSSSTGCVQKVNCAATAFVAWSSFVSHFFFFFESFVQYNARLLCAKSIRIDSIKSVSFV